MNTLAELSLALASRPQALVWFESLLLATINTTAVLGNLLVCSSVYRNRRLRTIPNTFVVALAISDILTSCLSMPLSVEILARGRFAHGQVVCYFQGFCIFTFGLISLQTMGTIALNRYFRIRSKPNQHTKFFTVKSITRYFILVSIIALTASTPPIFLDMVDYGLQPGKAMCLVSFEASIGYTAFVELFYVFTPLSLITVCYLYVFKAIKNANRMFCTEKDAIRFRTNAKEAKVTKILAVVFLGFVVCWLPVSVIDYIDAAYGEPRLNRSVYLMYGFLVYISSTLNPFIYGVMNRRFRREYKRILLGIFGCLFCAKKSALT